MEKKKIIKISITTIFLVFVLFKVFVYMDLSSGCFIFTIPTYLPTNVSTKKHIKFASPDDYNTLCSDIRVINKNISCGGFDGGCYEKRKPNTIFLGNDQDNLGLSSAIVIHELCHRQQAKDSKSFSELECYKRGGEFLEDIVAY